MNLFMIYQFCVFVHGKLFVVAFNIFANVMRRNVISIFKNHNYEHAEKYLMRISVQTNFCFIMRDAFDILH